MLQLAKKIATKAHRGQIDRSGCPYILHPLAVAKLVTSKDQKIVAILHDVVEDTKVTLYDLSLNFPAHIVDGVDAISRRIGEKYFDYVDRVKKNSLACAVKLADIEHNMRSDRQFPNSDGLMKRYQKAIDILLE